jgi:hypothetical protein
MRVLNTNFFFEPSETSLWFMKISTRLENMTRDIFIQHERQRDLRIGHMLYRFMRITCIALLYVYFHLN